MNSFFHSMLSQFAVSGAAVYALAGVVVIGFVIIVVFILSRRKPEETGTPILQLQQQIESIREQMDKSIDRTTNQINVQLEGMNKRVDEAMKANLKALTESSQTFSSRLESTARAVKSVEGYIGKLEESNKRIFEVGRDISGLQELLRAPKLRGGFGELMLERLLAQILPKSHFSMQHGFKSGERVDAVIHLGDRLVCIDSKFPMEDFKRLSAVEDEKERKSLRRKFDSAVKKHIDDIAKKYILTDEGTFNFAFMYIMAENVYYEMIVKDEDAGEEGSLQSYAMAKHVIPVSPNSFFAYLSTVAIGLKGLEIEKNVEEVIARLRGLSTQLGKFQDEFNVLGTHLRNASGKYDSAHTQLTALDTKIDQIARIEKSDQVPEITD